MASVGKRGRSRSASSRDASMSRSVTPAPRGTFNSYQRVAVLQAARQLARTGGRLPATSGELRNIDVGIALPAVATGTGTLTLLNGVAQGTTATTRLGRRITMKSIYIRMQLQLAATTTGNCPLRLLVVYDKQTNATAPVATDILANDAVWGLNNLGNSRRFVTLFDEVVDTIGTAGPQGVNRVLYKKLNHAVEFNAGSAGTVGDIQTGSVYALMYANNTTAVASIIGAMACRIRFADN